MKRFLTTGFFGAILGIVIGGAPADASLISRGFLDEVLTSYATNTALDLKANQSDFTDLSDKIGTLPSGEIVSYGPPLIEMLQDYSYQYPKDLAGIYDVLFGTGENMGVLERFATSTLFGVPNSFSGLRSIGTVPDGKNLAGMISETDAKIGTLPSGEFPIMPGHVFLVALNQPLTYPTSLAELINAIYGNSETGARGLLDAIVMGIGRDPDGDGQKEPGAGLVPNFELAKNANDLANANATKIGNIPTEYTTVGAALTAMKSDIDAKSLPSTSADGQYVLSAKKVGETISYTWVKMDLTNEEQSQ